MFQIRKIKSNEYHVLNDIENASDALFLSEGIDFSEVDGLLEFDYSSLNHKDSDIFVAVVDSVIVGFCFLKTVDHHGYIGQLAVLPDFTRQKIGSALINRAVDWAIEKNFEYLLLSTFEHVSFNAPMYAKRGFVKFELDGQYPELMKIREREKCDGLELAARIVMRKKLK